MGKFVIGIGEALWDMLPEGKKLGGAPANFAYHASQFGHEAIASTGCPTTWTACPTPPAPYR